MTTRIVMSWHLRQVMATRGIYQTSELVPLLAERGVHERDAGQRGAVTGTEERGLGIGDLRPIRATIRRPDGA